MQYDGAERREHIRANFFCRIVLLSPDRELIAYTENISKGGLMVVLEEKLAIFNVVGIEFFLDKDTLIQCEGHVSWVRERDKESVDTLNMFDTGIEFIGVSNKDKDSIEKKVNEILELEKKDD